MLKSDIYNNNLLKIRRFYYVSLIMATSIASLNLSASRKYIASCMLHFQLIYISKYCGNTAKFNAKQSYKPKLINKRMFANSNEDTKFEL